jgi:hypothetical protein
MRLAPRARSIAVTLAAALAATFSLTDTAHAATAANATYRCLYAPLSSVSDMTITGITSATNRIRMYLIPGPGFGVGANTLTTTLVLANPAGSAVTYAGTVNYGSAPITLGPIPRISGTISSGQSLHTIPLAGTPSAANWSLKVYSTVMATDLYYCYALTDWSTDLTYT